MAQKQAFQVIAEMKEFGTFTAAEQRYVRRSLDVALKRGDAVDRWARNPAERAGIAAQARLYRTLLEVIRTCIPDDTALELVGDFMGGLVTVSAFDLGEGRLGSFAAYRFLYERLLGAAARPWLASAFCAAAALPSIHPQLRKQLLTSISEKAAMAPGWSTHEPVFYPEWVEKVSETVS